MYVYSTGGEPIGFLFENFIYGRTGAPLGRIIGSRVHRLDGSYAGEWFHQMVVTRPGIRARTIFAVEPPPARPVPPLTEHRRDVAEYRLYADAFELLDGPSEPLSVAAA
jgi:hypothetical protein